MENTMENTPVNIFFNAREWFFTENHKNAGSRSFITDFMGNLVESYCLGNWHWDWTSISSRKLTLAKNTRHIFSFWLNGGENDRGNETCNLTIKFDDDWENRYIYKLNRNYIKYTRYYKGWYLYEIPFTTLDNEITEIGFESMAAYCMILPARETEYYNNLPHDEPIADVPQRHNMIFSEGYPRDSHWSWKVFKKEEKSSFGFDVREELFSRIDIDSIIEDAIQEAADDATDELADILREKLDELR